MTAWWTAAGGIHHKQSDGKYAFTFDFLTLVFTQTGMIWSHRRQDWQPATPNSSNDRFRSFMSQKFASLSVILVSRCSGIDPRTSTF